MSRYVLTATAQSDLADIREYYLAEAGYRIARQMLVEFVEAFDFWLAHPARAMREPIWRKSA